MSGCLVEFLGAPTHHITSTDLRNTPTTPPRSFSGHLRQGRCPTSSATHIGTLHPPHHTRTHHIHSWTFETLALPPGTTRDRHLDDVTEALGGRHVHRAAALVVAHRGEDAGLVHAHLGGRPAMGRSVGPGGGRFKSLYSYCV